MGLRLKQVYNCRTLKLQKRLISNLSVPSLPRRMSLDRSLWAVSPCCSAASSLLHASCVVKKIRGVTDTCFH